MDQNFWAVSSGEFGAPELGYCEKVRESICNSTIALVSETGAPNNNVVHRFLKKFAGGRKWSSIVLKRC